MAGGVDHHLPRFGKLEKVHPRITHAMMGKLAYSTVAGMIASFCTSARGSKTKFNNRGRSLRRGAAAKRVIIEMHDLLAIPPYAVTRHAITDQGPVAKASVAVADKHMYDTGPL